MKKCVVFGIVLTMVAVVLASPATPGKTNLGFSLMPNAFGPGLGLRQWASSSFGWGVEGMTNWGFKDLIGRVRIMYAFSIAGESRYYLLATGGLTSVKDSVTLEDVAYRYKVSLPSYAFELGYEKIGRRGGWAFEIGYQLGKADYEISYTFMGDPITYTDTFKMFPLYLGVSYSMYF